MFSKMPTWFLAVVALPLPGCATGQDAKHAAALTSGCPSAMITVVDASLTGATLDVCGSHQLWMRDMDGGFELIGDVTPRRDSAKNGD